MGDKRFLQGSISIHPYGRLVVIPDLARDSGASFYQILIKLYQLSRTELLLSAL